MKALSHRIIPALLLLLTGCLSSSSTITLHPERPLGPPIVGFGAQMNPYMYCRPNAPAVNDATVADLENKIIDLRPQHVRIFCLARWFFPPAQTVNPRTKTTIKPTTDPIGGDDAAARESFLRTVELAQRAGATINLTLWYGPFSVRKKDQLAPPGLFQTTAHQFVQILNELINTRHLTAVRYVTIQNEVNDEGYNGRHFKMEPSEYCRLYRALDAELRFVGLRDKVSIVAGDLLSREQEFWVPYLGSRIASVVDGYSMHAYWDYWDTAKPTHRLGSFADLVAALPPDQQKPIYAMEFGVRGRNHHGNINDPGDFANGKPIATTPLQASQMARFIIEAANRNYVAAVAWNMDDTLYDHPMQYGLIGSVKDHWPLKPAYQVIKLFTHTTQPGWRAIPLDLAGNPCITACAFAGDKGELSIFLLNRSDKKTINVQLTGSPSPGPFHQFLWNPDATGRTERSESLLDISHLSLRLTPLEMIVLTTTSDTEN